MDSKLKVLNAKKDAEKAAKEFKSKVDKDERTGLLIKEETRIHSEQELNQKVAAR